MNRFAEKGGGTRGRRTGIQIYVVDDEPLVLELVAAILGPAGYDVVAFREPSSALQMFRSAVAKPALLITDFAMKSMNGLQLLEECRRINPEQKALLVTGTVDESAISEVECKPNDFLSKPFKPREFVAKVKLLLSS